MPLHAVHITHFSRPFVTLSTLLSLLLTAVLIPLFGILSDKGDRLKTITFATTGLLMLSYPFMLAVNGNHPHFFLIMQLLIAIPCAAYYSVCSVLLTELFPIQIRCTALSIIFSIAASIAAGSPPVLADYLIRQTHSANAPCLIIIAITTFMLFNIRQLHRTYRRGRNSYQQHQHTISYHE